MINKRSLLATLNFSAILSLIAANCFPFVYCTFNLKMPPWLPHILNNPLREWLIAQARISTGPQYLWEIISKLFLSNEFFIGLAVTIFSLILPLLKSVIVCFMTCTFNHMGETKRKNTLHVLSSVSRWSMADVFIVGLCIVFFKAEGFHFRFSAGCGLYFYVLSSFLTTMSYGLLSKLSINHCENIYFKMVEPTISKY
jgi:hypothetical protein